MPVLRIDHPVPDYDAWKEAFDADPLGREASGVRRYRVYQSIDDPNHVWIDLVLDGDHEAVALRDRLQQLWQRVEAEGLIGVPTAHIVKEIDHHEYGD